ncbi:MAG: CDP-diacylglycerol--glycerol-3-phosphate 3-phosphatidyltransferase [Candidatus Cloacimonetes bacterium HGW-Cloacimonetes-3]|jgi:CDP-diacylglycerol--glycerol-3-phosphate 3-phosphatidyltransferase|nr:MAG: CDP-diacylglycerol--glycerol-3-phosphate 3-phosphatidyltransferase [Candidatus Cloacimonetes bacterium HGW-Cloacimonetes-3]
MKRNLPNALTILRFLMVPVFLYFLFVSTHAQRSWYALAIFVVASFTDYLDGMLARKFNVISDFGKIMDPLADKLLVLSALGGLCWLPPYNLSTLIFIIIFARELLVTVLREVYQRRGIVVAADKLGKIKTVMQMLGIIAAFTFWAINPVITPSVLLSVTIWFWLVAVITVISGLNYLRVLIPKESSHA